MRRDIKSAKDYRHRQRSRVVVGSLLLGSIYSTGMASAHVQPVKQSDNSSPRPSQVRTLEISQKAAAGRELRPTATEPFSMVGAAWAGQRSFNGKAQIRVRNSATGAWSRWRNLHAEGKQVSKAGGPKPSPSGRTGPLWVGPSDAVEARITSSAKGERLPEKISLTLVDPRPGVSPELSEAKASPPARLPEQGGVAAAAAAGKPPMTSRAQWRANENITEPSTYGTDAKAVLVHAAGGTNDYSCADSAAMVKGIQAYHMSDPDHMWKDIGYNFLVDKCGTIFEGRAGGADRPVVGFHTPGFDTDSVGIALLGDVDASGPTTAAMQSLARLGAWKLGLAGHDPAGTVTMTATVSNGKYEAGEQATFPALASASEAMLTSTPDERLNTQLPYARAYASSPAANSATPTSDLNRDGASDLVAGAPQATVGTLKTAGAAAVVPGSKSGPNSAAKQVLTQNAPGVPGTAETGDAFGADSSYGDLNGDGHADLVLGAPGEDDTEGHSDSGYVTALYGPGLDRGEGYSLDATSRVNSARLGEAVTVGDFNSDGKADIFALAPGTPATWWVRDSATAAMQSQPLLTAPGTITHPDAASGDFNRDGYTDVAITYIDPNGTGRIMQFNGSQSGLKPGTVLAAKGGRSIAAGDLNGDAYADIAVGQPYTAESDAFAGGQVTAFYGSSDGITTSGATAINQDSAGVPGAAEAGDAMGFSVTVGDANLDGVADVMTGLPNEDIKRAEVDRKDAGAILVLPGGAGGLTGVNSLSINQDSPGIAGDTEAGDRFGSAVSLADLRGNAWADLSIGAEGENTGDGTILYLETTASGVNSANGVYFGSSVLGLATAAHAGQVLTP
ncbi:FG-GAP-like repeat-containing protein [Streptomyces kanamyceticus]|uniref:FG-GAP-like repeat-containing protein n=1 Tax=Streptomyces kanamyceticus TaxID=1967 RepID=UPI0037DC49F1